eukprot:3371125-Prymnesium_polylepis.1
MEGLLNATMVGLPLNATMGGPPSDHEHIIHWYFLNQMYELWFCLTKGCAHPSLIGQGAALNAVAALATSAGLLLIRVSGRVETHKHQCCRPRWVCGMALNLFGGNAVYWTIDAFLP